MYEYNIFLITYLMSKGKNYKLGIQNTWEYNNNINPVMSYCMHTLFTVSERSIQLQITIAGQYSYWVDKGHTNANFLST